jgi:hypothetical protein
VSDEWLENLLAALISLRAFTFNVYLALYQAPPVLWGSEQDHLLFVRKVADRAPHLEYFAVSCDGNVYRWKRVKGEWVPCNRAEFPLHSQLRNSLHRFETYH